MLSILHTLFEITKTFHAHCRCCVFITCHLRWRVSECEIGKLTSVYLNTRRNASAPNISALCNPKGNPAKRWGYKEKRFYRFVTEKLSKFVSYACVDIIFVN